MKKKFERWTALSIEDSYKQLASSPHGLTSDEAKKRLEQFGQNESETRTETVFTLLAHQFESPFNYLLLIAAIIAFSINEVAEGFLIGGLALINVVLGLFQEYKAYRAMILLRHYIPSETRVLRDSKEVVIHKSLLVPGDIVILDPGMMVPADLRIIETPGLLIDEAVLTGESIPVEKKSGKLKAPTFELFYAHNIAFAATTIMSGSASGIVFATGNDTMFHNITIGGPTAIRISSYEKNILRLSQSILAIVIASIVVILGIKILLHGPLNIADFFIFSLALIVAIVPEALPTVTMFSLSQAALKLVRNQVVVKRLSAIEDLGDIEILCTDKTGTLTATQLSLDNLFSSSREKSFLFLCAGLNHRENHHGPSAFEELASQAANEQIRKEASTYTTLKNIPFDATRMHSSLLLQDTTGTRWLVIKGAPEKILALCNTIEGSLTHQEIAKQIYQAGTEGKRTFAIAYKPWKSESYDSSDENNFIFLGFFSFVNPLKKGVEKTIKLAKQMGISVKMITGDSKEVAGFIAKQIGLIDQEESVITGAYLSSLGSSDFDKVCLDHAVFARIDPATKANIITSLQQKHEVGFIGEGINDVPALKQSNIALVVQGATDVARSYADIILLKRDMHVIIEGIRQGRIIFSNINKYIRCTLASNFGNYYSLAIISLILPFLPLLPSQILLINLLSDFPLISIASDTVDLDELKQPKAYHLKRMLMIVIVLGLTASTMDFIFLYYYHQLPEAQFRTLWFIFNVLSEVVFIFSIRTMKPFFKASFPSMLLIITSALAIMCSIMLPYTTFGQEFFQFTKPTGADLMFIGALTIIYFCTSEIVKLIGVAITTRIYKKH